MTGRALTALEWAARRRKPKGGSESGRTKVYFLVTDISHTGGISRTTVATANELASDYDVEIISQVRRNRQLPFRVDQRVRLTCLTRYGRPRGRVRRRAKRWLRRATHRRKSWLVPKQDPQFQNQNLWLDLLLLRKLQDLSPGVVIATRLPLSVAAARFARTGVKTVGQEHMNLSRRGPELRQQISDHFTKLDAVTVLSTGDRKGYRRLLAGTGTRVVRIPNSVPAPAQKSDLTSHRVVAVGRCAWQKGFDLLIEAFGAVADKHPDWELRIYGAGPQLPALRRQVEAAGLQEHVFLMGETSDSSAEMARGSIFALSSRYEGFGMVLVEAMAVGLPVVSFRAPRGPADIITDGVDGTLVPREDVAALSAAIIALIEDPGRRRAYAEAAIRTASAYEPEVIGQQWRTLIQNLASSDG